MKRSESRDTSNLAKTHILIGVFIFLGAAAVALLAEAPRSMLVSDTERVLSRPLSAREAEIQEASRWRQYLGLVDVYGHDDYGDQYLSVIPEPRPPPVKLARATAANCTAHFQGVVLSILGGSTMSDPAYATQILRFMYLDGFQPAEEATAALQEAPQDLTEVVDTVQGCAAQNPLLSALACQWKNDANLDPQLRAGSPSAQLVAVRALTLVLVLDQLTSIANNNQQVR